VEDNSIDVEIEVAVAVEKSIHHVRKNLIPKELASWLPLIVKISIRENNSLKHQSFKFLK